MKRSDSQANHEKLNLMSRKTHRYVLAAIHLKKRLHSEPFHFLPQTAFPTPIRFIPHGHVSVQGHDSIWRGNRPIWKELV